MISDETVERVRASADIVQIISEYVPLKRSGADYRGPCPFHQGKNPNFSVSQKRGSYHCFVCHESGDVFTFIRKRLGLDWPAAVRLIGEKVGIEVVDTPTRAAAPDPNERNWEVLAAAAEWFQSQLLDESAGRAAREYLVSRSLEPSAWERFGLGFAPRDAQLMRRHLHTLGYDDARLLEAGLLAQREGTDELRPRFRGRLMFPILDELSRHVGFGGRALGDDQPKYLNSPESNVFHKRRTLYNLATARQAIRRAQRVIVVEGYMDAIRLVLAGVEEVVAPLGTALTEEQARLLVRYGREVYLLYDSDEAGQKATFRSGLELLRQKAEVRVVSLPDGEDPDSFVQSAGRNGFEQQVAQAIDLFDRQLQLLMRRGWFADLRRTRQAIDKLLPTIRAAAEPLTHDLYLSRLAEAAHVDKATLAREVEATAPHTRTAPGQGDAAATPPVEDNDASAAYSPDENAPAPIRPRSEWKGRRKPGPPEWRATLAPPRMQQDDPIERALVRAMLASRSTVERVAERHGPDSFRDQRYRAIFAALLASEHDDDLEVVASRVPADALSTFRHLVEITDSDSTVHADYTHSLARFEARKLEERIGEIRAAIKRADTEEQSALLRERMELEGELRRLVPVRSPSKRLREP